MKIRYGYMRTARPGRYAKQLASHWSNRCEVTQRGDAHILTWANGQALELRPTDDRLTLVLSAPDEIDADLFASVVAAHLVRFSARQQLRVSWVNGG